MIHLRVRIAVCAAAAISCAGEHDVRRPAPPVAPTALVEGPRDRITVPAPMRLVAAYGEDAWRFIGSVQFGPVGPGRMLVGWDHLSIYVIDPTAGQPVGAVSIRGRRVQAAAVDASGTRVAAITDDGVLYWPALDAEPVPLVPTPPTDPEGEWIDIGAPTRYRLHAPSSDADGWAIARSLHRLSFAPDGARLVAGMHIYDLASRRDLLPLRTDEIVLDVDHDAAVVARLAVVRAGPRPSTGGAGRWWRELTMVALERRAPGANPDRRAVPLPLPAPVPDEQSYPPRPQPAHHSCHSLPIVAIDVADDGRIVFVQDARAGLITDGAVTPLRVAAHLAATQFQNVTLGDPGAFAVVWEFPEGRSQTSAVYAFDRHGAARARVAGETSRVSRAGRAVLGRERLAIWDLSGAPHSVPAGFALRYQQQLDQPRAAGRSRIVVHDTDQSGVRFVVRDPGAAPRTITGHEVELWSWTAADDGSTIAWVGRAPTDLGRDGGAEHQTLHVVDLDRATESIHAAFEPGALGTALATSAHVTVAGDDRGGVHVWRHGVRSKLDLGGRHDLATAAAISPRETYLAIGTARGRILVIAL